MNNVKGRFVSAQELMTMVNSGQENVVVKIAHAKAPGNRGNFRDVLEFSEYLDNEMMILVTAAKQDPNDKDVFIFDFDASPFESHNIQYEKPVFYSVHDHNIMLTSRESAKEVMKPFSMVEKELGFASSDEFFVVENPDDFYDYAMPDQMESALLDVTTFVANQQDNVEVNKLVQIGYFAKKIHLGTATEIEKRVYRTLLAK